MDASTILTGIVCKQCKNTLPPHSVKTHLEDPTNSIFKCPHKTKILIKLKTDSTLKTHKEDEVEALKKELTEARRVIPILQKTSLELIQENDELKKENEKLKKEIETLKAENEKLRNLDDDHIIIPKYYHIDEETGRRVWDTEEMTREFEEALEACEAEDYAECCCCNTEFEEGEKQFMTAEGMIVCKQCFPMNPV
jgi:hypothetical protein